MRVQRLAFLCTTALLAVACSERDDVFDVRRDHVIGGALDSGDPATVALRSEGWFFCSGTLISPHVVLTAAHCLEGATAPQVQIFFGTDANTSLFGEEIQAREILPHPDYDGESADMGLVALEEASTVTPVQRNAQPLGAEMMGQDVRVVGFGLSVDGGEEAGEKRTGIVTFESIEGDYMMVRPKDGVSGCYGDSGGSNFMMLDGVEVLAGVTSFGTEDSCLAGLGGNTDVQKFAAWIDEFVTRAETPPSCDADDQCVADCATPDPDCACVADGACSDVCPDWLHDDPDCSGCGAGDGCWLDCPDATPDPDCPAEEPMQPGTDEPGGGGDGGCVVRGSAPRGYGGTGLILLAFALILGRRPRRR
jgi:hypothetical protein